MNFATVLYVLLWGGWGEMGMRGYEDRQLASACQDAATKSGGAVLLRVVYARSAVTYANICDTPRCSEPPALVTVERVTCQEVPEQKREVIEPAHWRAKP